MHMKKLWENAKSVISEILILGIWCVLDDCK